MKFLEPKTLDGATSPMIVASWFFGIGILQYPMGHPRPVISFCWSIINLCLYLSFSMLSASGTSNLTKLKVSRVSISSFHMFIVGSTLSIVTFQLLGRMTSKHVAVSLRKLNVVNEMLNEYQIPMDYGATFKYQIIQLIGLFLFIIIARVLNILSMINRNIYFQSTDFGNLATLYYTTISGFIVDCTFTNLIRYIGKRFEHLNANLRKCSSRENNLNSFLRALELGGSIRSMAIGSHVNPYSSRFADKQSTLHLIRRSRKIHQDLCSTARRMNEAFGMQILLSMTMSSVLITSLLYGLHAILVIPISTSADLNLIDIAMTVSWLIFYITRIFYIVHICSTTSTQSQRMGTLIYHLDNSTIDREVREEIRAFSFLLMQNPLQFTASGFFTLDYGTIRSIVGTVTTYLVIMIQLHNSYDHESGSPNDTSRATNATY